jgi:hypothetical protein
MNAGSGKNLNWFWKKWFFDNGCPDLAISSVTKKANGYDVMVTSKGNKPVPIDLTVFCSDGTTSKVHRSIGVWEKNNSVPVFIPVLKRAVKITLGSTYDPDVSRVDNSYQFK